MARRVSFNFQLVEPDSAVLTAVAPAALYGRGVFTTVALRDGIPILWDKHLRRLETQSGRLGIEISRAMLSQVRAELTHLATSNDDRDGRARVTIFDTSDGGGGFWSFPSTHAAQLLIATSPRRPAPPSLRLVASPFTINTRAPFVGLKTCNYLENLAALGDARTRGFDECVRLNERGEIASAAAANLFWTRGSNIFTPSLETGCLAGTTRESVIDNFEVEEVAAGISELEQADEIFLTSAGLGVVAATFGASGGKPRATAARRIAEALDFTFGEK